MEITSSTGAALEDLRGIVRTRKRELDADEVKSLAGQDALQRHTDLVKATDSALMMRRKSTRAHHPRDYHAPSSGKLATRDTDSFDKAKAWDQQPIETIENLGSDSNTQKRDLDAAEVTGLAECDASIQQHTNLVETKDSALMMRRKITSEPALRLPNQVGNL